MAGLGRKVFTPGEVLTATNVQNYLMDQAVQVYAGTAARGSAIGSATTEGMVSYLQDYDALQVATGTATWVNVGSLLSVPGTAARNALFPSPILGDTVFRSDIGFLETYYSAYNAGTNPGGASVAGWYPREGTTLFAGKRTNTSLSLGNGVYTNVTFNTFSCAGSTSNTDTIQISSDTTPATFTVRKAGWYLVQIGTPLASFSSTAGSVRLVGANRNSTTANTNQLVLARTTTDNGPSSGLRLDSSSTVLLAANDIIRFWLYQDSGATATNNDTNASIIYLRPASV
jgi:hypothetical protein